MNLLCPNCQKMLTVPEEFAGQLMKCPLCSGTFTVPGLPGAAPPPPSVQPEPDIYTVRPEPLPPPSPPVPPPLSHLEPSSSPLDGDHLDTAAAIVAGAGGLSAHAERVAQPHGAAVDRAGVFVVGVRAAILRLGRALSRRSARGDGERLVCRLRFLHGGRRSEKSCTRHRGRQEQTRSKRPDDLLSAPVLSRARRDDCQCGSDDDAD